MTADIVKEVEMAATTTGHYSAVSIGLDKIRPSEKNRKCSDSDADIAELADSIKSDGLLTPIKVRPVAGEMFEIVFGERRWRAFRLLGATEIPAIVAELDERQAQIERITENFQRKNLTYLEEGEGILALLEVTDNSFAEVAARLGQTEAWVRRRAKLPNLSPAWREELARPETEYVKVRDFVGWMEQIAMLPIETQDVILRDRIILYARTIEMMRRCLASFFMNLDFKPWQTEWDKTKVSSRRRCDKCMKRSDKEKTLFDEIAAEVDGDKDKVRLCLDPDCWQSKAMRWCAYLHETNPDAQLIWGCYPTPKAIALCEEHIGLSPLKGNDWMNRSDEKPVGDYTIPVSAIVLGGARAGQIVDIWLRDDESDQEFDRKVVEKQKTQESQWDVEIQRENAIRAKIGEMIPEDVFDFKAAAGMSECDFAHSLLNWAAWIGLGEARHTSDAEMDILNVNADSCPGLPLVWSQVRLEIIELFLQTVDEQELNGNDWALVTSIAEILRIDTDALVIEFAPVAE